VSSATPAAAFEFSVAGADAELVTDVSAVVEETVAAAVVFEGLAVGDRPFDARLLFVSSLHPPKTQKIKHVSIIQDHAQIVVMSSLLVDLDNAEAE
jgi:hypothetical protein